MKKAILSIFFLSVFYLCPHAAQIDTLELTDQYLDTVSIRNRGSINDYSMLGINYGITFSNTVFSPSKHDRDFVFTPNAFSIMYTHYEKMFGYIPYFGFTAGFAYGHEGVTFKKDKDSGEPLGNVNGADRISIEMFEIPVMAQIHVDFNPLKMMLDVGPYVGWRHSIERSGSGVEKEYANKFYDYENRFDYGMKGGAGFGVMLDPVEIQFMVHARWSWMSLYKPDYYSEYFYRFANPVSIIASVGISFQLTKRKGMTSSQLKKKAYDTVYGKEAENTSGQGW